MASNDDSDKHDEHAKNDNHGKSDKNDESGESDRKTLANESWDALMRQIPQDYSEWPRFIRDAIDSGRKFGYNGGTYKTVSRHRLLKFLCNNEASPFDVIRWMHFSGRLSTDGLGEFEYSLNAIFTGAVTKPEIVMGRSSSSAQDQSKRIPQFGETGLQDFDRAMEFVKKHGRGAGNVGDAKALSCLEDRQTYFAKQFPYSLIARLLNRTASPFQLREIVGGMSPPIFRSRPVLAISNLKFIAEKALTSLHVGNAFEAATQRMLDGASNHSDSLGTEMVLEIDHLPSELESLLNGRLSQHADLIRWRWLKFAVTNLVYALREDFGVKHVLIFVSGNRSPHIWLLDEHILRQSQQEREEFFKRLSVRPATLPIKLSTLYAPVDDGGLGLDAEKKRFKVDRDALLWPKPDPEVATGVHHVHRAPFSINDKSDRIALPCTLENGDFPTRTDDMPRIDSNELKAKLAVAKTVVEDVILKLNSEDGWMLNAEAISQNLRANDESEWWKNAERKKNNQKTKGSNKTLRMAARMTSLWSLPPLNMDMDAARAWMETLRDAAKEVRAGTPLDKMSDKRVASMISKVEFDQKDGPQERIKKLEARIQHNYNRLGLIVGTNITQLTNAVIHDPAGGRLKTWHQEIRQQSFFTTISSMTRHAMTRDRLLELDISGAHPAAAFAAVVARCGGGATGLEEARRRVPNLALLVTNRPVAVAEVKSQYLQVLTDADAKRKILESLNKTKHDKFQEQRKPFLKKLVEERDEMEAALLEFPPLLPFVDAIRDKALNAKDTTQLALLMQATENLVVTKSIQPLEAVGWLCVAVVSDAIFLERDENMMRDEVANASEAKELMESVAKELGIDALQVKVDHAPATTSTTSTDVAGVATGVEGAAADKHRVEARAIARHMYRPGSDRVRPMDLCVEINAADYSGVCFKRDADSDDPDVIVHLMVQLIMTIIDDTRLNGTVNPISYWYGKYKNATRVFLLPKPGKDAADVEHVMRETCDALKTHLWPVDSSCATTASNANTHINAILANEDLHPIFERLRMWVEETAAAPLTTPNGLDILGTGFLRKAFVDAIDPKLYVTHKQHIDKAPTGLEAFNRIVKLTQTTKKLRAAFRRHLLTLFWPRARVMRSNGGRNFLDTLRHTTSDGYVRIFCEEYRHNNIPSSSASSPSTVPPPPPSSASRKRKMAAEDASRD